MNILITGSNGFIAKELISRLEKDSKYILYKTNRQNLDILDTEAVNCFFNKNKVDVVIHCAISGGRRTQTYSPDIVYKNILMFENLAQHRNRYNLMINFGTAAEFDKTKDIDQFAEHDFILHNSIPKDYYGFSKYIIARRIDHINDNIINLRVFNVFGEFESSDRMIKNNIINYLKKKPLEIHRNRYMDFFGANDLYKVIDHIINSEYFLYRDLNMCYKEKHTLSDVVNIINNLSSNKSKIKVVEEGMSPPYCGDFSRLSLLDIEFDGLEKSIKKVYDKWKK